MYCSKCGNEVSENDKFCQKCGNRLDFSTPPLNCSLPVNSFNISVPKSVFNYDLIGFILSIALLPISIIIRFAFAHSETRYGWREYQVSVLSGGMKVVGVFIVFILLVASVICVVLAKKNNKERKNKFMIPTIVVDAVAVLISLFVLLG